MITTLLIDGDILVYQESFGGQKDFSFGSALVPYEEVEADAHWRIEDWRERLRADSVILTFSVPTSEGWRRQIYPEYKANRAGAPKPEYLHRLREDLTAAYPTFVRPTLEADDILGILATHPKQIPGKKIVVSIDKDLRGVPCRLFNPKKNKIETITKEDADHFHLLQTLTGDRVDGIPGLPGVGPKKAEKILSEGGEDLWQAVVKAYEARGLTEEDALLQARLTRICRYTDYDFNRREVKLWCPK